MSHRQEEGLDRRDFMIASIATVGASAALAADAGSASAQDAATSSVSPVSGARSATVYTGDTIQGKRLLARLTSVGSQRTSGLCRAMSAFGGEAEVARRLPDVA